MKHHLLSRVFSLMTAALLSRPVFGSFPAVQSLAAQPEPAAVSQSSTEPVTVIVRITGGAVMEQPDALEMGSDYLGTGRAARLNEKNKAVQQSVQERIRTFYPALKVGFSYSTLYNGFSCELPENLIGQVRAIPDVVSVTKAEAIEVPQMNRAAAFSGFPAFYEQTGCSGEGQVIAVIDSELDISHPMFAPLAGSIHTAVSREKIASVIRSGVLNADADPNRAYISSKLPFVIDYTGDDPYGGVSDPGSYHGTHVSGIAAGNAFEASDGTTISGIAKDAQLMFFGVSEGGRMISTEAGLAAMEDAVQLGADVINMSWGTVREHFGENPMSDAICAADRAGIIVCCSAGNGDNGVYSMNRLAVPENPDTGNISDKAELGSPVMIVASANNPGKAEYETISLSGKQIVLMPRINSFGTTFGLSDELAPGEYQFADCGTGTKDELEAAGSLTGKIALVQRTAEAPDDITANAKAAGACAVILIDRENTDGMEYVYSDIALPLCGISFEDGQAMRSSQNKVISVTGQTITRDIPSAVSSYSAWGVKQSLDLRPDIMGIGGSVRSAAYDASDRTMSGTSMSSPYLAGCTAVIREYLKKQGTALSGSEFAAHVRRLLMNTAVPYQEDGLYVTPRRQGAGLVSLDRAAAAKVLMSGNSGDAKINLFDKLGDTFSFPLTLTNDSSEDVTYPKAEICLTTDGTYFSDAEDRTLLRGQQALRCTADFTGPVTVRAEQSKTVTVTVALDPAQSRALSQVFRYGFFTEGYLLLSGAENSADISIPMLGFHGDWAQIPAVPAGSETVLIEIGADYNSKPVSIIRQGLIYQQILSRISDDVLLDESAAKLIPLTYASAKEKKQLAFITDECWLSPDGDSIAERISTAAYDSRSARGFTKSSAKLLDSEGNVIYENPDSIWIDAEFPFSGLPDGEYTYEIKRILDYPDSAEHPQFFRCKVHIDTQKPEIRSRTYTENGRTYLMIEASDNGKLQGITVSGTGFGCRAGEAASDRSRRTLEAETLAELLYDTGFGTENLVQSYGFDTASLPPALRCFAGIAQPSESKAIQFADVLEPEPDDDGIWTVKYDITDLQHYSFTVLDEAYNFAEIRSQENAAEELAAKQGIWLDQTEGVYEIGNGKIKHTSYLDGSVTEYSFTAARDQLILTSGQRKRTCSVSRLSDTCFQLTENGGRTAVIRTGQEIEAQRHLIGKPFFPVNRVIEEIRKHVTAYPDSNPEVTSCSLRSLYELVAELNYPAESGLSLRETFSVSIFTGRGRCTSYQPTDETGVPAFDTRAVYLFPEYVSAVPQGLYALRTYNSMLLFDKDGKSGTIIYNGRGRELAGTDTPFTYTIGENGALTLTSASFSFTGTVMRDQETGGFYIAVDREPGSDADEHRISELVLEPVVTDPENAAKLRSSAELCQLASAYLNAAAGETCTPANYVSYSEEQKQLFYGQFLSDGYYYGLYIDPVTLHCTDLEGNSGNLLQPPKLPANAAYTLPQLTALTKEHHRERTGIAANTAAALIRHDGLVMILLLDASGNTLERYLADAVTGSLKTEISRRGDVNCDGRVDVSDAVLLARFLVEDTKAVISSAGIQNADCDLDHLITPDDMIIILRVIAKLIVF